MNIITHNFIQKQLISIRFRQIKFIIFANLNISTDSDPDKIILCIHEAMTEVKEMFNLPEHMIGYHLTLSFEPITRANGFYQKYNHTLKVSNKLKPYETTSAIIHEYTHHMQFYNESIMSTTPPKALIELVNLSQQWIDYPVSKLYKFLVTQIFKQNTDHNFNQSDLTDTIENVSRSLTM